MDTGAIYRTVGLFVARSGGDCGDKAQVLARLSEIRIAMTYGEDGLQHMLLNGEDVTKAIRENAVSGYASLVSAYPEVRAFLLDMQRALARTHNVIMDGGTSGPSSCRRRRESFPDGLPRRAGQAPLPGAGAAGAAGGLPAALRGDHPAGLRRQPPAAAPLKQAEDAVLLDTSALDFDASLEALLAIVKERVPL